MLSCSRVQTETILFESPCCRTVWQSAPIYVIAACSEKELLDRFTHPKKVHLNCLEISPRSAQYNGQKGTRQPRLTSPSLRKTARFLHAVDASTRMRRVPRQHALAVGETAPAFPTATPLHKLPSNGSQLQSSSAHSDSRVAKC